MKFLIIPVASAMGTLLYFFLSSPVVFQSAESRTIDGGPVFNEIKWSWKDGKEVWSMRQSHGGRNLPKVKWDKLAIVMEKEATFLQFDPQTNELIEYKVSCFMCHSNGPRSIRPEPGTLSFPDLVKVQLLNLRIKLYGQLKAKVLPQIGNVPFRHSGKLSNEILKLPRCTSCHQDKGFFSRGFLTRQNAITIEFMVKQQHMPPIGSLSLQEQAYLSAFMEGF